MSEPADPRSMLSALQNRLLVCRGCNRARARAGSPVTTLPASMRAKPGSMPSTPDSLATANPKSLISMATAPMFAALDVDGERDGGVRLELFRRGEVLLVGVVRRLLRVVLFLLGCGRGLRRARLRRAGRR